MKHLKEEIEKNNQRLVKNISKILKEGEGGGRGRRGRGSEKEMKIKIRQCER